MEVKIGITDSPRELVISTGQTPTEVEELVQKALTAGSGIVSLTDDKGRKYLVQAAKVAYVEIGKATPGKVGFGAL